MKNYAEYQAAACLGKEAFDSPQRASRAIRSMRNRKPRKNGREVQDRGKLGAYRCKFCGHWHVGAAPRTKSLKVAAHE